MPIFYTARFKIHPAAQTSVDQAIREFIAYIKANEPGTLSYVSLQEKDDPTSYLHTFIFQDEAARNLHTNSPAVERFTAALYPETLEDVEFTEYTLLAATPALDS
jgi:quinol monooxygenase YgiN